MTTTLTTTSQDPAPATSTTIRPQVRAGLVPGTATEVTVSAGRHTFTIDEPATLGGTDRGANPVEHLLAALGACQVITYQVWAEKLGLRIDRLEVELVGDVDLRGFTGADPDVRPGFAGIDVQVQLSGPDPDERYEELHRLVERHCPVLDTVVGQVPVAVSATHG